uniref:Uncharacterized protein n=1 Tax=Cacopsylla melanoneura TaxID=428564 RepID=A0A8D8VXK6_9HEMI
MCVVLLVAVTVVVAQDKKEDKSKTPGKRGIFSEGYGYSDDISYPAAYLNTDVVSRVIPVEKPVSVGYVNTDVVQQVTVNRAIPIEKPVAVHIIPVEVTRVPVTRRVYVDRPVVLAERAGYPAFAGLGPKFSARYGAEYYGVGGYVANYGAGTSYGRSLHHVNSHHVDLVGSTQLDSGYVESAGSHAYGYVGTHAQAHSYDHAQF